MPLSLGNARFTELRTRFGLFEHRVLIGVTTATPWGDQGVYVTYLTHLKPEVNRAQAAPPGVSSGCAG